jgi:hypothetical protein
MMNMRNLGHPALAGLALAAVMADARCQGAAEADGAPAAGVLSGR